MKSMFLWGIFLLGFFSVGIFLIGCKATNTLASGVAQKSISGSGTVYSASVGLDKTTQTPELSSLFVWGDYTSVVPGDEVLRFEESEDASIFNSNSKSKQVKLFFSSGNKKRVDEFLKTFGKKLNIEEENNEQTTN